MSFPRYPKYKDSGVEWLGEVPEGWETLVLKRDLDFVTSGSRGWAENYADDGDLFIRIANLTRHGIGLDLTDIQRVAVPDGAEGARTRVEIGDVLFSITAYLGSVAVVPDGLEKAYVSQHVALARLRQSLVMPRWVGYVALSFIGQTWFEMQSYGGTKIQLSLDDIRNLPLTVPPVAEQHAVVDFLDRETTKIDELVAEQRRLMELLKEKRQAVISHAVTKGLNPLAPMKPSNIEWLGDVPAHWEVTRVKKLASVISKGTTPTTVGAEFTDDGVRFLKAENVTESGVSAEPEFFISQESHELLARSSLEHDDVLVVIAGATTGKSAVLGADLLPANTNQAVSFIRPKDRRYGEYINGWLGTPAVRNLISLASVQSAQPNLSMEDLGNIPLPLPPPEELESIRTFVASETAKLDALAAEAQKAIDLLQERRTALISAAVTGQIDVRKLAAA